MLQTTSTFINPFRERHEEIKNILMSLCFDTTVGDICECGLRPRNTRCIECFASMPTCQQCFVESHLNRPFHWADVWSAGFFQRKDFCELGGVVYLGHHGRPCHNIKQSSKPLKHIVAETNGIHNTSILYCECHDAPERWAQLLRHRLFPSTIERPATAFTFALMNLSHRLCLRTKSNVFDLSDVLRRQTNEAFAQHVPVMAIILCAL